MASASSLHSEEQFLCSICLEVFIDPITTSCGHNYCKTCITKYWDTTDVCQCPLCKEIFYKRPKLSVNKVFSGMADQFRKSEQLKKTSSSNQDPAEQDEDSHQEHSKPDEVFCDICTETKLKALKSCPECRTSYCETHLELHQTITALKPHKLIDPVKNLEDYMCKKHDRPLELFCKTDHMCVCQFCTESDHKLHKVVSMKEEYEEKKAELGKTEAEVQQMIQERQVKIRGVNCSVDLSRKDADREIADSVQVFTAMISFIERSQAELNNVIKKKQKTTEKQAEGFIKELQQEITELKKRSSELKQLSHTEDHLHLLQNFTSINTPPPTKDWTKVNVHQSSYVGTVRTAVVELKKVLCKEMEKLFDNELRRIQQYVVDVTLDPDTAHPQLILSEDGKQLSSGDIDENLQEIPILSPPPSPLSLSTPPSPLSLSTPPSPLSLSPSPSPISLSHLFHSSSSSSLSSFSARSENVLGKQSFSGRFYYEVQVKDKTEWVIGLVSESIKEDTTIDDLWSIALKELGDEHLYMVGAVGNSILLPETGEVQKVGVFVDYEEGLVSFYDVEARVHLYSFTGCTFTDKLYPFFDTGDNSSGTNSAPLIISPVVLI